MGKAKHYNLIRAGLSDCLPNIWRFSLSLSGNPNIADDLTQATCLRALEKAAQFNKDGPFIGWALAICRSIWLNELRASSIRKMGGLDTANATDLIDPRENTEVNIFARQVYASILSLPEAQRSTVELVYVQEFTYSEAAQIMDVPIGTVMSRLSSARKTLATLKEDPIKSLKAKR
ncbi:MAG: RNA polymerase sigma factor [Pseudomonadota bacterium]